MQEKWNNVNPIYETGLTQSGDGFDVGDKK